MSIKYRTGGSRNDIEKQEIQKETEYSVWINGSRSTKWTRYHKYHDTWEDAKCHLLINAKMAVSTAESRLETARENLVKVNKLEKI